MSLASVFQMVAGGRIQKGRRFLWVCPGCFTQIHARSSSDRDRYALDHCLSCDYSPVFRGVALPSHTHPSQTRFHARGAAKPPHRSSTLNHYF